MHELVLAEDILRKIRAEAGKKGLSSISRAKIKLGEMRFQDRPELEEIFSTISGGIKLDIDVSPVKGICDSCKSEFMPRIMRLDCPKCGSSAIKMVSGQELVVEEIK